MERKYLQMQRNQFLKVKNSLSELEKDFIELKYIELKDIEVKIKREINELFFKPIIVSIVSIDDMDRFEKKKQGNEKIRPIKKTSYDRLINYIAKPIKNCVGGFEDKSFFKINTPNQTVYPRKQNIKKPFISE